jgi:hypothetical protein
MPLQEFYTPAPRRTPGLTDGQRAEQERRLREARESTAAWTDPRVSQRARDAYQERLEQNLQRSLRFRPRDYSTLTSKREGQAMTNQSFLRRLNSLKGGRFCLGGQGRGLVGLRAVTDNGTRHITTMQFSVMPEWDLLRLDEHGLPSGFVYRGWRSAVLALVTGGHITEREAGGLFPMPSGAGGLAYRRQLWEWRHRRCSDEEREAYRLRGEEEEAGSQES